MGAGIATVGRRKYAVGLYWQPSPSGRVAAAAKDAAKQPGQQSEFFAVRPGVKGGRVAQFGLGQAQSGHKRGMATLAGTLANRQPGSWAGAFKLMEGVVVIVVRDDLIAPDGDQIYIDEAAARDRLVQEVTLGGLQRIYAPEAWSIPASETLALPFVLQNRGDCPLQPVTIPRSYIVGVVVLGVLAVVGLGGAWWYQDMQEKEEQERQAQLQAVAAQKRAQQANMPGGGRAGIVYPPPQRFWEDEPPPLELVTACRGVLAQAPPTTLGWRLGTVACTRGGLSLNWSRLPGFTKPMPEAAIDSSGSSAGRSIALAPLPNRAHEDLFDPVEITQRYLAQNWSGTITRLPDDPPPPRPPNVPPEDWQPPPAPWIKRGFNLTLTDLPGELPQYLTSMPGVIIKTLTNQSGNWVVEGVIYENRK